MKRLVKKFDSIVIGAGHNGLVCASYLAKEGKKVLVLEKRHLVGGACVTEEIFPGFKFSRASYLCSLLRKNIINDLKLFENGLELITRNPSSFTPLLDGRYLFLGPDMEFNKKEIAKFSKKDSEIYEKYVHDLDNLVAVIDPLIDAPPLRTSNSQGKKPQFTTWMQLAKAVKSLKFQSIPDIYDIFTAPATKILTKYFESEPLISTLATDAIIGEMIAPSVSGSAYVLLHHVMGDGETKGSWSYVRGGMGQISNSIAKFAQSKGVDIQLNSEVKEIITEYDQTLKKHVAKGVRLADGTEYFSDKIISNCVAHTTFNKFIDPKILPEDFIKEVNNIDYTSGTFKINVAVKELPNFKCIPNVNNQPGPQHRGTVHFIENLEQIETAFLEAKTTKRPCKRPVIEMTIPSALDNTLAPSGQHVVQLFTQYAPYELDQGTWDDKGRKETYAESVFNVIEEYCPGFKNSIIGSDLLSPLDIERTFGLKGGNIFGGSIRLDQLYFNRPVRDYEGHDSPVENLYLSGCTTHPGGGVMGAAGRNCAKEVLKNWK